MLDWHDEMMRKHNNRPDPLWTVIQEGGPLHARGRLPEYIDYLKQTDREWAIPELTKRHPQEFSS
jgi:choline-sulfatase